jgi:hypothetical protein
MYEQLAVFDILYRGEVGLAPLQFLHFYLSLHHHLLSCRNVVVSSTTDDRDCVCLTPPSARTRLSFRFILCNHYMIEAKTSRWTTLLCRHSLL